jgi:hypothetical protein
MLQRHATSGVLTQAVGLFCFWNKHQRALWKDILPWRREHWGEGGGEGTCLEYVLKSDYAHNPLITSTEVPPNEYALN